MGRASAEHNDILMSPSSSDDKYSHRRLNEDKSDYDDENLTEYPNWWSKYR